MGTLQQVMPEPSNGRSLLVLQCVGLQQNRQHRKFAHRATDWMPVPGPGTVREARPRYRYLATPYLQHLLMLRHPAWDNAVPSPQSQVPAQSSPPPASILIQDRAGCDLAMALVAWGLHNGSQGMAMLMLNYCFLVSDETPAAVLAAFRLLLVQTVDTSDNLPAHIPFLPIKATSFVYGNTATSQRAADLFLPRFSSAPAPLNPSQSSGLSSRPYLILPLSLCCLLAPSPRATLHLLIIESVLPTRRHQKSTNPPPPLRPPTSRRSHVTTAIVARVHAEQNVSGWGSAYCCRLTTLSRPRLTWVDWRQSPLGLAQLATSGHSKAGAKPACPFRSRQPWIWNLSSQPLRRRPVIIYPSAHFGDLNLVLTSTPFWLEPRAWERLQQASRRFDDTRASNVPTRPDSRNLPCANASCLLSSSSSASSSSPSSPPLHSSSSVCLLPPPNVDRDPPAAAVSLHLRDPFSCADWTIPPSGH
ncbi:hypothetical protein CCMA1212_000480 [Trichoderma ghanense]|uniref:Uncharacterized protein n=1 Tax=Trichoderma ghanense TaxID=65468 RepID=A0ABY2HHQ2_9HYPO